jgi:ketosteroid isomerase-like protein
MSQEDAEKLEAWLRTWDLDALVRGEVDFSFVHPEVAYEDAVLPDHVGEVYRGHERMTHAARVWLEPFETFRVKLERVIDGGDRIVSIHRFQATARYTGIEFDVPLAWLFTFEDGMVTRWRAYASVDEALEAAGLRE